MLLADQIVAPARVAQRQSTCLVIRRYEFDSLPGLSNCCRSVTRDRDLAIAEAMAALAEPAKVVALRQRHETVAPRLSQNGSCV